jgi:hypothetical protein
LPTEPQRSASLDVLLEPSPLQGMRTSIQVAASSAKPLGRMRSFWASYRSLS